MRNTRIIARLDIKSQKLIKGIQLEGLRIIGDPSFYAEKYYREGIDELIFMDSVASLYGRNNLLEIVKETAKNIFVPLTVGGGIRSLDDANNLFRAGADKVAINTAAIQRPELITEISNKFGKQAIVLSIEAKINKSKNIWEAFIENGREPTGLNAIEWALKGVKLGAGEILLTSIDREGTRRGFDIDLIKSVTDLVPIPVIASGGMGKIDHFLDLMRVASPEGIAIADCFHYSRIKISEIRKEILNNGIKTREVVDL
nr:glycosyl amidation-associated protein WbuZ [Pigmentibacter ruber]